ncbi:uncharacterized protein ACN427_011790 isoform 1-T1 [Glossina fuscipes fuscipes]
MKHFDLVTIFCMALILTADGELSETEQQQKQTLYSSFSTATPLALELSTQGFMETMEQALENSQKGEAKVRTVSFESEQKQIQKTAGDVEVIELRAGPAMEKQEEEVSTGVEDKIERMEEDEVNDGVIPAVEQEVGEAGEPEGEQAGEAQAKEEAEPEVEVEAEAETEVEAEQEALPEAEAEAELEVEPEAASEAEPEVEAEAEPKVGPEAEPTMEAEKESEPGAESAEPEKGVEEKLPEDESNIDGSNVKEQETNSNTNNAEEGVPTGAETQQPNPAETEEKLQNDAPAGEVEINQEKPHLVETINKIKPDLCFTCNSKEDSACEKRATEQVTCKKTNNNNSQNEHSGCYSMFDEKGNTTMRGCVSDLTEQGFKYCLKSKKFCELCYSNICNNKKITGGAADLHKLNIILLALVNIFTYINCRDIFIVNAM